MKPNPQMLFGNIFDDERITPINLESFSDDVLAKLTKNNIGNVFNPVLIPLKAAQKPFRDEIGEVDTTFNQQLGKTQTVDEFILEFTQYMRDNYINIAAKLGGDKTPAFLEFYPKGKTEYNKISKTRMPTVMDRLEASATAYATVLGAPITPQLKGFQKQWDLVRGNQRQQISAVETNRIERSKARRELELSLLKVIHFVADKYPGDVEQCMVFFNFNLLFSVRRSKGGKKDGGITDIPKI